MNASILTASHYGVVHFGDLDCEAVVLTTGERGYIQRQLARALGLREKSPGTQIGALTKEFTANSLSAFEKKGYAKMRLPSGQTRTFFLTGIIDAMNHPDFKHRCEAAFAGAALQLGLLLDELEEDA